MLTFAKGNLETAVQRSAYKKSGQRRSAVCQIEFN